MPILNFRFNNFAYSGETAEKTCRKTSKEGEGAQRG